MTEILFWVKHYLKYFECMKQYFCVFGQSFGVYLLYRYNQYYLEQYQACAIHLKSNFIQVLPFLWDLLEPFNV